MSVKQIKRRRGEEVYKISNLKEAIECYKEFYKRNSETIVGYIATIKYIVARCSKEELKKEKFKNHRTYKISGNYWEVLNMMTEWGEEKVEIYKLENLEEVLCYEISLKTGILIESRIGTPNEIISSKGKIYVLERRNSIFQAVANTLYKISWKNTSKKVTEAGQKNLREKTLEEQIEFTQKFFAKHLESNKKYKNKYITEGEGEELINIIYNTKNIDIHSHKINVVQKKAGFYILSETSVTLSEEDQRPINARKLKDYSTVLFIAYDFEFNWIKRKDGSMISTFPKQINVTFGRPVYGNYESKKFTGPKCCENFFDFLMEISEYEERTNQVKTYCVAHNAASTEHILFIAMIMRYYSAYNNYRLDFGHVSSTKIFSFKWRGIEFRDSLLFFPESLAKYTKAMGVTQKKEIEIVWETADWDNPTEEMNEYASYDSISLYEAAVKHNVMYNKIFALEYPKWFFDFRSGSSISKYLALSRSGEDIMYNNLNASKLLIHYYYGGRCEALYVGNHVTLRKYLGKVENPVKTILVKLDINSSYPYSMTKYLPGKILRTQRTLRGIDREKECFDIFGYVKYKDSYWENFKFALIPERIKGLLTFPNLKSGSTFVNIKDFDYDLIKDHIELVIDSVVVYTKQNYFRATMEELYSRRQQSDDEAMRAVLKYMMNGAYGSLGMNPVRETIHLAKGVHVGRLKDKYQELHQYTLEGDHVKNWRVLSSKEEKEIAGIMQMASYISALSRRHLFDAMEDLTKRGYKILYVDTDSIICADTQDRSKEEIEGSLSHIVSKELGDWKIEGITEEFFIQGPKMYRFDKELKCKGIRNPELEKDGLRFTPLQKTPLWLKGREGLIGSIIIDKILSFDIKKGHLTLDGDVNPLIS